MGRFKIWESGSFYQLSIYNKVKLKEKLKNTYKNSWWKWPYNSIRCKKHKNIFNKKTKIKSSTIQNEDK